MRRQVSDEIEAKILTESKRRCAICYGLNGSLRRKTGQIAHIDHDNTNSSETNLAFLCLKHHDEYDSRTSQAKNITQSELKRYKSDLLAAIVEGKHVARSVKPVTPNTRSHDKKIFKLFNDIIDERWLRNFIARLENDHSYILTKGYRMSSYIDSAKMVSNFYIDGNIQKLHRNVLDAMERLNRFISLQFFVFPDHQVGTPEETQLCLKPDFNLDRGRNVSTKEQKIYLDLETQLCAATESLTKSYFDYRRTIKIDLQL